MSFECMNYTEVVDDNQFGLGMCVVLIRGRVGMDYHHTIHIMHVGKHRYAYLICREQCQ